MDMETILNLLNSIHPLSDPCKQNLISVLKTREVKREEHLLKAGRVCRDIWFIEKGLLRCYYSENKNQASSWFMMEGDVVTAVDSFYEQTISYEYIEALEDSLLY